MRRAEPSAASSSALERRLLQRDEQLDQRTDMLEERDRKLLAASASSIRPRKSWPRRVRSRSRRSSASAACRRRTPRRCCSNEVRDDAEHDAVRLARAIERKAREDAEEKARDVVVTAIQRVMVDHTAEMTVYGRATCRPTR